MKKLKGNKGFALVETIICALFVAAIFTLLFTQLYPISGNFEATEYFDDIETKYIAHYLRQIITTDRTWTEKTYSYGKNGKKYSLFDLLYKGKSFTILPAPEPSSSSRIFCEGTIAANSENQFSMIGLNLSNEKSIDPDTGESTFNGRNNAYYCHQFVYASKISRVWFAPYNLTTFIKNNADPNSSFANSNENINSAQKYFRQLPTHSRNKKATSSKPRYMWMIIEVQHENKDTDKLGGYNSTNKEDKTAKYYYSYAKIEVHD